MSAQKRWRKQDGTLPKWLGWSSLLAMRKVLGTVLVMLAMVCQAHAARRWVEVSSPHFKVLTDAGKYEALELSEHFERMRETFATLLRAHPKEAAPVLVIALRNKKEFREIEPAAYLGRGKLDLAGYFMLRGGRAYILLRLDMNGPHPYATIYHEYTHYMLRDDYTWMPLWLNEGLAEFYQNTDIHPNEVDLGQPDLHDLMYLRTHKLIPIATLMQITASSPYYHEEQQGTIFYAESWALVHYLIVSDRENGTLRLETYENNLKNRENRLTAARNAFGSLHQLEKQLRDYLNHLTYAYFRLRVDTQVNKAEFHERVVPEPEADAMRAGVMIDSHRMKEARKLLQAALKIDPNSPKATQMMGYLELRSDKLRLAENWYAGALHLDPASYEANYRFAECAMLNGDETEDAKVESSLRKAIKLNPDFAPAYDLLAQFYDIHQIHEAEAHRLEAQAITLEPENVQYRLNAAVGLANRHDFNNALRVLQTARQVARNHAEMGMINDESRRIRAMQAMVARAKSEEGGSAGNKTTQKSGQTLNMAQSAPDYPGGPPAGAKHTVTGVVKEVSCYYPTMLVLAIDAGGKSLTLYRHSYFDVKYSAVGVTIQGDLHPCTDLQGMRARITYAAVNNSGAAGQILTIQLVK